jgi:WD40 repeat protein
MAKAGFKRSLALGIAAVILILLIWLSKQFNNSPLQVDSLLPNGQTFSLVSTLTEHTDAVSSLAISPDSTTLVSGSHDKTIKLWNLKTGELFRTLEGHQDGVLSVFVSPDGQTLASGGIDSTLRLWKLATGQSLKTLPSDGGWITSLTISPDGETLAKPVGYKIDSFNQHAERKNFFAGVSFGGQS